MAVEHFTPQQVLEILQENHRQMSSVGDAFGCLSFDMDSTVEDWCDAMMWDYFKWRGAGKLLNWLFETDISDETWHELLIPTETKMLAPVCECIAAHAVVPVVEPLPILGMRCAAAGVFLTLRDKLQARGLDVSELGPSTRLEPFLIDHAAELYPELIKFGVGRIPKIKVQKPLYDICLWGLALWIVAMLVGVFSVQDFFTVDGALITKLLVGVILYIGLNAASRMKPRRIRFGDLHDFRDLCRVLASSPTATSPTP